MNDTPIKPEKPKEQEMTREQRVSKLAEIAEKRFPSGVSISGEYIYVSNGNGSGYTGRIASLTRTIDVLNASKIKELYSLAEEYESYVDRGRSWTVRIDPYRDRKLKT